MQRRDIIRSNVSPSSTAAKRHGRKKVRRVTDGSQRGRGIHTDAKCRFAQAELPHHLIILRVQAQRVTKSSEIQNLDTLRTTFLPVFDSVEAKNRRELLHRDRMLRTNTIRMRDQRACVWSNTEPRHLRNLSCGLSDDGRVQRPPRRLNSSFELSLFLQAADVRALFPQLCQYGILNRLVANNRLLRGAESPVIKTLSCQNVANGFGYISRLFDVSRNVPWPYTERWFAGAVRCSNEPSSSCRQ